MQEAARLSQPQRARLLSLRAALLQDIDRITCERKAIMGGIKASLPHRLQLRVAGYPPSEVHKSSSCHCPVAGLTKLPGIWSMSITLPPALIYEACLDLGKARNFAPGDRLSRLLPACRRCYRTLR